MSAAQRVLGMPVQPAESQNGERRLRSAPAGIGTVGSSLASGADSKKVPAEDSWNLRSGKRVRKQAQAVGAIGATHLPLLVITEQQQVALFNIYHKLCYGKIKEALDIPVGSNLECAQKWMNFDWFGLSREVREMQEHSVRVQDIHPLTFLAHVFKTPVLKQYLSVCRQQGYVMRWHNRLTKLEPCLRVLRVDVTAPWERTVRALGESMNSLGVDRINMHMEAFLAELPEAKREPVKVCVAGGLFEPLLNLMID